MTSSFIEGVFQDFAGGKNLPPIVFIHGDLQNHTSFKYLQEVFAKKGHATLSFDLPGHGLSKFSQENSNLIELVKKIIDENKIIKPIIIGNSSGGTIAIKYALETQNASALILINSPFFGPKEMNPRINFDGLYDVYKKLSEEKFKTHKLVDYSNFKNWEEEKILQEGLESTDPKGFINNMDFYKNLPENSKIYSLEVPVLFLFSSREKFIPLEYVKKKIEKMARGKIVVIEGDHNVMVTNPEKVIEAVEQNYDFIFGQKA